MEFINFHIAYLLTKHERVIIPDFGAFIVTKMMEGRRVFSPPAVCSLTFSPDVIQDDGLLVGSIAQEKSISYSEALHLVYNYVDDMVRVLREGQAIHLHWIGRIYLSDDRKIIFTPATNLSCNASNCGLAKIHFPTLTDENTLVKITKKTYEKPQAYNIVLVVVVLLLTVLFIFLFLSFLNKNRSHRPNNTPLSEIPKATPAKPSNDATPLFNTGSAETSMDTVPLIKADYYIVLYSSEKEKEAKKELASYFTKGLKNAKIMELEDMYRITVDVFNNREQAAFYLDMYRKNNDVLFKDAWILEVSR